MSYHTAIIAAAAIVELMRVEEPMNIQPTLPAVIVMSEESHKKQHDEQAAHKQREPKPRLQKGTKTKKNSCHQPHKSNH